MLDKELQDKWKNEGGNTIIWLQKRHDAVNSAVIATESFKTVCDYMEQRSEFIAITQTNGKSCALKRADIVSIQEL